MRDLLMGTLFMLIASGSSFSESRNISISRSYEENINICIKGKNRKEVPGPEKTLHGLCESWKSRTCCDASTTKYLHEVETWFQFDWGHCGQLSRTCMDFMLKDACFYECSPNLGPWRVYTIDGNPSKSNKNYPDERFMGVPICERDCRAWWHSCRHDLTCSGNWYVGPWNWTSKINQCIKECRPMEEYFKTPKAFCENIWGGAYKMAPKGDDRCMRLHFTGENPNDEVCRYYAKALESKDEDARHVSHSTARVYGHTNAALCTHCSLLWSCFAVFFMFMIGTEST
ncbi:folate receptor gamma-like [Ptychodera flava]|uniref:folate receptor gamma-like n=1 Tax=Ptychodera flava TaxID=63121 RepID=UPI003969D8C2